MMKIKEHNLIITAIIVAIAVIAAILFLQEIGGPKGGAIEAALEVQENVAGV